MQMIENTVWIKLEFALMLQLLILFLAVFTDHYFRKEQKHFFYLSIALSLSLVLWEGIGLLLRMNASHSFGKMVFSVYGFCIRPVFVLFFLKVINAGKKRKVYWYLAASNALCCIAVAFIYGGNSSLENYEFVLLLLKWIGYSIFFLILFGLVRETVKKIRHMRNTEQILPILNVLILAFAAAADLMYENGFFSFLTVAIISCSLLYYIWLHLQFEQEHEQAMVAEQRIQIMISQIQPHFLFNTLSTIQALCRMNPEKAFETTEKFGTYLRQNIDSLGQQALIPFEKELEHTKIYAEIEMLRFPSVRLQYDIQDSNFTIPALSVQPLVENAIRHGVRIRAQGIVTVSTRLENSHHVIIIYDNGKGFDVNEAMEAEGTHIGIRNVRERIEAMCDGTLNIISKPGEGTTAIIRIPCERETE